MKPGDANASAAKRNTGRSSRESVGALTDAASRAGNFKGDSGRDDARARLALEASEFNPPARLAWNRGWLCKPRDDEGPRINAAVLESWAELSPWMPWARVKPTVRDSEFFASSAVSKWRARREFDFSIEDASGGFLGKCSLHTIAWERASGEIGYWLDSRFTGRGMMTEAARALCDWALSAGFERLEIRCDVRNIASQRVAERLGFTLESHLVGNRRDNADRLADTLVWAKFSAR